MLKKFTNCILVKLLNLKANINLFVGLSKQLEIWILLDWGGGVRQGLLLFLITKFFSHPEQMSSKFCLINLVECLKG